MYSFFRKYLFQLDPERAHGLTLSALSLAGNFPLSRWALQLAYAAPAKPVSAFGLSFKNPVGLAAGYDKDGVAVRGLAALGFGHVEVGTVTPLPQPGNPQPRVFRLPEDEAVINRMGFPGYGSAYMAKSLKGRQKRIGLFRSVLGTSPRNQPPNKPTRPNRVVLGVNIGKNKS